MLIIKRCLPFIGIKLPGILNLFAMERDKKILSQHHLYHDHGGGRQALSICCCCFLFFIISISYEYLFRDIMPADYF